MLTALAVSFFDQNDIFKKPDGPQSHICKMFFLFFCSSK